MAIAFVASGAASAANNAATTPGIPAGMAAGGTMALLTMTRRASDAASIGTPAGWTSLTSGGTAQGSYRVQARAWQSGDAAPSVAFTGVAGDTVISQIAGFTGLQSDLASILDQSPAAVTNGITQNIGPGPALTPAVANSLVLYFGLKKNADSTGVDVLAGDVTWAEAGETESALGNAATMVWDYAIEVGTVSVTAKTFTVNGGTTAAGYSGAVNLKAAVAATGQTNRLLLGVG